MAKAPSGVAGRRAPQYLRVQASQTGLANAVDDGRNIYLGFGKEAPDDLAVFDQDGKPLTFARAGAVAAVSGLHRGVLVRAAGRHSFVAPNPVASPDDRPNIDDDPDVVEARSRLEGEASQAAAFQRAIERASSAGGSSLGSSPVAAALAQPQAFPPMSTALLPASLPASLPARLPENAPMMRTRPDDFVYQRLPNGASLIRVFFASNSRVIVRPDDGLRRLEEEARGADEVRITGFTDSAGSRDLNNALAHGRAEAVRFLLMQRGVAPERIVVAAVPAAQYLAENVTDLGRALNRRAEIVLLRRSAR